MQNSSNSKSVLKDRSYQFALETIRFIRTLDQEDFGIQIISKQLFRCATSIGANVTEAQSGSTKKDFANFFNYALKSANETRYWLTLLKDLGENSKINKLIEENKEISNMLAASIITLKARA
ncbi:MAG: four helix bundle protein [Candidatus Doudnabacteria bacterium]|nr:four helix bundle protein [Candidatus Doudnabacteria bacterium]